MKRRLQPEEVGLWTVVVATVRPISGRASKPIASPATPPAARVSTVPRPSSAAGPLKVAPRPAARWGPDPLEPGRRRRIVRGRDEIAARLDLHGMDQDRARSALVGFLQRAQREGARTVLVITGKGVAGQGVLRRRAPEWLADPALRPVVAGLSFADPHHGGEGALYVALKRLAR